MAPTHHCESLKMDEMPYMVEYDKNYKYAWKIDTPHTEKFLDFNLWTKRETIFGDTQN